MEKRKVNKKHRPCQACRNAVAAGHDRYVKKRILAGAKVDRYANGGGTKFTGGRHLVPAIGTRRRLRALSAIGWGWPDIAKRLGHNARNTSALAARTGFIRPETAQKVQAIYDELSMIPGTAKLSKDRALAKGYLPPLCWDDAVIDDPYGVPSGMTQIACWRWYHNVATLEERFGYVLTNGFPVDPNGKRGPS